MDERLDGPAPASDATATLAEWRVQGADRIDPVRFLLLEALARRAAAQTGEARRLLDARLAALIDGYQGAMAAATDRVNAPSASGVRRGALGELVDELARDARPTSAQGPTPPATLPRAGGPQELKALQRFHGTWSRLSAEQRLRQALAHVPPQAGPLNSHHLMHRALVLMRDTSPAYLQRFVAHVDTLLWLDQLQSALVAVPTRAERRRRAGRS